MEIQVNHFVHTLSLNHPKQPLHPHHHHRRTVVVHAVSSNPQQLIKSGTLIAILPKDAAAAMNEQGYQLLDIRPQWEREKSRVSGSMHVPLFVQDMDNGLLTLLKKWVHFGYIGLWTGQYFTMMNPDFVDQVEKIVPDKTTKLLVACGEGLRGKMIIRYTQETKFTNMMYIIGKK
nr:rhodanese-like domain-containing protein 10 [Tanacetum cinerariifolium]